MTTELRMCVIDDIKTVVQGISDQINWESHGIRIVGTASNGEKGIELINQTEPHIVLTDIRMPKINGLEMTQAGIGKVPTDYNCFFKRLHRFSVRTTGRSAWSVRLYCQTVYATKNY